MTSHAAFVRIGPTLTSSVKRVPNFVGPCVSTSDFTTSVCHLGKLLKSARKAKTWLGGRAITTVSLTRNISTPLAFSQMVAFGAGIVDRGHD